MKRLRQESWSHKVKYHSLIVRILTPIPVSRAGDSACGSV